MSQQATIIFHKRSVLVLWPGKHRTDMAYFHCFLQDIGNMQNMIDGKKKKQEKENKQTKQANRKQQKKPKKQNEAKQENTKIKNIKQA